MSVWDTYQSRITTHGETKRGSALKREIRYINNKLPDNLSYQEVTIYDQAHGYNIDTEEMAAGAVTQNVAIINSDNLNEKYIYSLPGEDIEHGSLVHWMDNYWLVTERDANTTLYTRAKLLQCNYLLRWVTDEHEICEQWCVIEDGTKYLTGEYEDRNFIVTRGDSRISMTLARNEKTKRMNRDDRFLIDDPESPFMLAYALTKPLKLGWTFNNHGIYKFVLQEVTTTDNDNQSMRIADYYKHFPKETVVDHDDGVLIDTDNTTSDTGKKVWL